MNPGGELLGSGGHYPLDPRLLYRYRATDAERPGVVLRLERRLIGLRSEGGLWRASWEERLQGAPAASLVPVTAGPEGVQEGGRWILRTPLLEGRAWRDGADEFRVASLQEGVVVPAGPFGRCLKVVYGNDDLGAGEVCYAPALGRVRWSQRGERGSFLQELERVEGL